MPAAGGFVILTIASSKSVYMIAQGNESGKGIARRIREARVARGLRWCAAAKQAGIANPSTVREIEYGRDTKLSSVQAVVPALGLRLELVAV
jgi:hypothetical protein